MSVRENIYANFLILIVQNAKARKVENGGLSSEDDNQGPNAPEVDADVIFAKLKHLIDDFGLEFKNMIGYGSYGLLVVSNIKNCVRTRVQAKNTNVMEFTYITFHLVENTFFKKIIYMLDCKYKVSSERTIATILLDSKYKKVINLMKTAL